MKIPRAFAIFQSVLAALFGIQKAEKAAEDFEHGGLGWYILAGVVLLIVILGLLGKLALYLSGV